MKNFNDGGSGGGFGANRDRSSDRGSSSRGNSSRPDSRFGGDKRRSFSDRPSFGGSRDGGSNRGGFGGSRGGGFGGEKVMHRATCAECGSSCEVPFKPTGEKPVYCSSCFGARPEVPRTNDRSFSRPRVERAPAIATVINNDALTEKVAELNAKIDRLLDILIDNKGDSKVKGSKVEVSKNELSKKAVISDKKELVAKKTSTKKEISSTKAPVKKVVKKAPVKKTIKK